MSDTNTQVYDITPESDLAAMAAFESIKLEPGEIMYVLIEDLNRDDVYQRTASHEKVDAMAESFNVVFAGQICVNIRSDGSMWVMDGWHRVVAARKAGLTMLRAEVWRGLKLIEEAYIFIGRNLHRYQPSQRSLHRAKVVAGDPTALALTKLLSGMGLSILNPPSRKKGANKLFAIAAVEHIFVRAGPERLIRVLNICLNSFAGERAQFNGDVIKAIDSVLELYDEGRHPNFSYRVFQDKLSNIKLVKIQSDALVESFRRGVRLTPALAIQFIQVYNMGRKREEVLPDWISPNLKALPSGSGD